MLTSASKIDRNPQVVFRELGKGEGDGEGGVLLHLESGQYHGLNPLGCYLWERIDGTRTVGDLVAQLQAEVADPPPQLEADVTAFLQSLAERDLIVA